MIFPQHGRDLWGGVKKSLHFKSERLKTTDPIRITLAMTKCESYESYQAHSSCTENPESPAELN